MSFGSDTTTFKKWAQTMGCPVQLLPSDDILKRYYMQLHFIILDVPSLNLLCI